ncbi:type I-G CRISPR-associated protein Csb2 [Candidatus Poriferisodalis sp.]|uniref:type I-G CRISPR-associated protein Csb2 n=1 Tax=Candidatus Poriferisodalis sp. TaxID=3101277 RepID=UPI003B52F0D2
MIAVEVTLLTGRYVATAHHDRREHEWPPHPARLFSALVATWAAADVPDVDERRALEWLEGQAAPAITASRSEDTAVRRPVSHFVPVNDASVVSGAQYRRRVERLSDFLDGYYQELESTGGEVAQAIERLRDKIDKERDVASMVGPVGTTNPSAAAALLPEGRGKQERQFPSVTPDCPHVTFSWETAPSSGVAAALDVLLGRVTRLGHSSSLVSCRLLRSAPEPTMRPGNGTTILRCAQRGQLAALEQMHAAHEGIRPRALPFVGVRYAYVDTDEGIASAAVRPDIAGELVVFELPGDKRHLPLTRTVELTEALRGAVFHHADDPLPEGLSGHLPDGRPSRDPHIAFLALPNVGHIHADGRLMGMAVILPDGLDEAATRAALRAIGLWERAEPNGQCRLTLPGGAVVDLQRKQPPFEFKSLEPRAWSRPSHDWVSATPIALPKNPGRLTQGSPAARAKAWAAAEDQVRQSCVHVDLPEPASVAISLDPLMTGARPAAAFPAFVQGSRRGDEVRRRLVHAALRFDAEVEGPVVLGSGRFLGLGLMRPLPARPTTSETRDGLGQVEH